MPRADKPKLLDQVRDVIRRKHYSIRTEQAYIDWIKRFIIYHGKRHPGEMGEEEVAEFLTHLARDLNVAASTQNQALSALLFLYREVLGVEMPWLQQLGRPVPHKRIPVVLTHVEVQTLLARMSEKKRGGGEGERAGAGGETGLLAHLLYGTGMRLLKGVRLRVKDVDLVRQVIVVRDGKGGKDRVERDPLDRDPDLEAREPFFPCYRATPSSTAAATSAS